jgi:hypothetical protein
MSIILQVKHGEPPTLKRHRLDSGHYKTITNVSTLVEQALGGELYVLLEDADAWTTIELPAGSTVSIVDERLLNGEV